MSSLDPRAVVGTGLLTSPEGCRVGPGAGRTQPLLLPLSPRLPPSPLTLIIYFAHDGLQAVLLPCLINGSSIQGDGISLLGLLGTCGSALAGHLGPFSRELRGIH